MSSTYKITMIMVLSFWASVSGVGQSGEWIKHILQQRWEKQLSKALKWTSQNL
jgi:hypothetical protein